MPASECPQMIRPQNDCEPGAKIAFTKASACGNDFLLVEGANVSGDLAALTRRLCDRHRGVGADGVEWLFPDTEADVNARLLNADGSEAEISGNGTRCVAAEICSRTTKTEVVIRTGAGLKTCRLIAKQDPSFEFETDMGAPELGSDLAIETDALQVVGMAVSMGNPHFVIFVQDFHEGWQSEAALIGKQPQFPQGTNVEYVAVRAVKERGASEIEIRIFERGAGETQSSGTGSCAAAVAAIASARATSPVKVVAPGGSQTVRWEKQVYLQGPATLVCRGEFFI
jgi:diaminopimelate epimerase